jgi:hypothetical protein
MTTSGPAAEVEVVGKETWAAGDRVETGYETSRSPWLAVNIIWLISCCALFLVCGK